MADAWVVRADDPVPRVARQRQVGVARVRGVDLDAGDVAVGQARGRGRRNCRCTPAPWRASCRRLLSMTMPGLEAAAGRDVRWTRPVLAADHEARLTKARSFLLAVVGRRDRRREETQGGLYWVNGPVSAVGAAIMIGRDNGASSPTRAMWLRRCAGILGGGHLVTDRHVRARRAGGWCSGSRGASDQVGLDRAGPGAPVQPARTRRSCSRAGARCEHFGWPTGRCRRTDGLEADHVHPHSRGGRTVLGKAQVLCA